jgi:hypothetical protein
MPLYSEDGFVFVADAFGCFIIGVYEPRFKLRGLQGIHVYVVTVILCSNVAAVGV